MLMSNSKQLSKDKENNLRLRFDQYLMLKHNINTLRQEYQNPEL